MKGINFEFQKKYYDEYWNYREKICIDEKCRKSFIISVIKNINLKSLKILDLGCGRGWLTEIFSKYGDVLGIDLSVDRAKKIYPFLKFKQANIVLDEIEGKYNIIVSSEVIEHLTLEHQHVYIKKIHGLLDKNGFLILTTPNRLEVEKLVKSGLIKQNQLQPIENWLDRGSLLAALRPYFEIKFVGSVMFYPVHFRKYKLLNLFYHTLYCRLGGYKLIDLVGKKTNRGLYLVVWAQKKLS